MKPGIDSSKKGLKIFFKVLEITVYVSCAALYFVLMGDIWMKFTNRATTTGIQYEDNVEPKIPCLSFCAWQAFTKRGFFYTEKDFLDNTFRPENIFSADTMNQLKNESYCSFEEVYSGFNGRCFTVCVKKFDSLQFWIRFGLKRDLDLQVFVHRKGEELWIAWTSFPTEDTNYFLDVGSRKGLKGATFRINEIQTTRLNRENNRCITYPENSDFVSCCKNTIWSHMNSESFCIPVGMKSFVPSSNLSLKYQCNDSLSASRSYRQYFNFMMLLMVKPSQLGCPFSCQHTR